MSEGNNEKEIVDNNTTIDDERNSSNLKKLKNEEESKSKKKIIIFCIISLIIIIVIVLLIMLIINKKDVEEISSGTNINIPVNEKYNIIDKTVVIDDPTITVVNNFLVDYSKDKYIIKSIGNKKLFETDSYYSWGNDYLINSTEDKVEVYNSTGDIVKKGKRIYWDFSYNKYIIIDDELLDTNLKVIYKFKNVPTKKYYVTSFILNKNNLFVYYHTDKLGDDKITIINIDNDKYYTGDYNIYYSTQPTLYSDTSNRVYDSNNELLGKYSYPKIVRGIYYNKNDAVMVIDGEIRKGNKIQIDAQHYIDYTLCKKGGKLVDNNGKVIINDCNAYYLSLGDGVYSASEFEEGDSLGTEILYANGKKVKVENEEEQEETFFYDRVGNYIYGTYDEMNYGVIPIQPYYYDNTCPGVIINNAGKVLKDNVLIKYYDGDLFVLSDYKNNNVYFADKDLKKVGNVYDDIICNTSGFCAVSKSNSYELFYKTEKVVDK